MLVLYTDGLVETRLGHTDERIDRAAQIARQWSGDLDGLPQALVSDLCPNGSPDDVAILVARFRMAANITFFETALEPDHTGAAAARRFASDAIAAWSPAPAPDELVLVVSEMATNAIVHARPPLRLRLTHLGDEVLVELADGVRVAPYRRHPMPCDERGRGLQIMAALALRSGVSVDAHGKTVWCTVAANR
jgi:anti-sigma regulatory factor (Ser/Thr protein kinase)